MPPVVGPTPAPGDGGSAVARTALTPIRPVSSVSLDVLLDELRLAGAAYFEAHQRTTIRYLAVAEAERRKLAPAPDVQRELAGEFARARGFASAEQQQRWLAHNHLTEGRLEVLLREEALVQAARNGIEGEVVQRLVDQIRLSGGYRVLLDRALEKQHTLTRLGLEDPSMADAGLTEPELLAWYLGRQQRPMDGWRPQGDGFRDADAFRRAALREFCYLRSIGAPDPRGDEGDKVTYDTLATSR